MIVIACGVSCFCCRDRNAAKDNIPCEYHEKLMEKDIEMELFYHFCKNCTSFFSYELLNDFLQFFAAPYGTTMSRMPTNMGRQQGFMMDPHAGKLKVLLLKPFLRSEITRHLRTYFFIQLREMYLLFAIDVICARPISNFLLKKSLFQKSETFDVKACIRF